MKLFLLLFPFLRLSKNTTVNLEFLRWNFEIEYLPTVGVSLSCAPVSLDSLSLLWRVFYL